MRKTMCAVALLPAVICAASLIGCGAASAGQTRLDANRTLGKPVTFRNLSVVPVYDTRAAAKDSYATLDEGLKAKHVIVKESPSGGDVNRLYVTNTGPKPVYIIAGEVVLGGQQDRCVGKDTIIPPGKKGIPITVFCVEHGRWAGAAAFDSSAVTVAAGKIRMSAQEGAVKRTAPVVASARRLRNDMAQSAGFAGESGRIGEGQSKVWAEVARKNQRFGAAPASGTYRDVLQGVGGRSGSSTAPYIKALAGGLPKDGKLVGVVAAVDGKVVAADIFGDTSLFRKLWPKLLRSYASDAAEAANGRKAASRAITANAAKSFLAEAASGKSKAVDRAADNTITRLEGRTTVLYRSAAPMAGGAMAGKAVHENYLGK